METTPVQNNPTKENKFFRIVLILVVVFAAALFLVSQFKKSQKAGPIVLQEKIKNTEKAETEPQEVESVYKDGKLITGKILEINGNKLTVKVTSSEPLVDQKLETRIVEITTDTKIYQLIPKSVEQYQKELEEFNNASDASLEMPLMGQKKDASPADFQKEQEVRITSGDDISNSQQFKASEIDIRNEPYSLANN